MEFKNIKEIIDFLYELADPSTKIIVKDREATIDDFKEELEEALYQLSDMLGMEDLYLEPSKDKGDD